MPTGVLGGPSSPLVLYGDTSQDGLWYGGDPATVDGHEFGDKPFNPFVFVPDAENEDDEWLFPLGNPFRLAGNDVIDASALFADVVCNATCTNLPSVGITAYGGAGNDRSSAARPATTSPAAPATTRSSASAASTRSTATRASTSTS